MADAATSECPNCRRLEALLVALEAHFRFITTPGVEPTNDLAEQPLRFVVIDRRITQGTRGEAGRQWCERFWTVRATCAQQDRSVFEFLHSAVTASFTTRPARSLLAA
ncbi:MAG: hypothetical protein GXY85_05665 [Candidatus Brocadiaceae bacterium]|nr:hypothetical protein [Candidatus Brocadiaceae bacterium]